MRRGSKADQYIKVRIEQLKEEIPKNEGDEMTVNWYNRLIQELQWVVDIEEKSTADRYNCWMGENVQ